jgi:hypothetical protein
MRLGLCVGGLVATGVVVFSPFALGRGGGGGGGGGQGSAGYGGHYGNPFWSPGYPGPGSYDAGYSYTYTPTPEQQSTAQKRVNDYLVAIKKGRRRAATHRYIALETLRPTKAQREAYLKKRAEAKDQLTSQGVNPAQLRCVMVFDTQTKQFVGSGCYIVGSLPAAGGVAKFESVSAEFVGQGTL